MKIAWFTPFSIRSAIGEFSRHVVNELARTADVELWIVDGDELHPSHVYQRPAKTAAVQPRLLEDCTIVVYNFGDHLQFHEPIAEVAAQWPGIVILHDRSYQHLLGARFRLEQASEYVRKMKAHYHADGQRHALGSLDGSGDLVWENEELALRFPLVEEALIRAEGAVAHSPDHADEIRKRWGGPVATLFLPTYPTDWVKRKPGSGARGRSSDRLMLLTVGHVNRNKQIDVLFELLGSRPDLASRIRYVILGPYDEHGPYIRRLRELIDRYVLHETVQLLGYQTDEVATRWMADTDIFINLRHPNLEGGSASLMRQLAWGKPVVVYDSGVFATVPDGAAAKVRPRDSNDLEANLRRLMDDAPLRKRIGAAGREWAHAKSVSSYADRFLAFVEYEVRPFRPLLALADRAASRLVSMQASPSLPVVERVAGELAKLAPPDFRSTAESEPTLAFRELGPHDAGSLGALFEANDIPEVVDHFDPFPLTHATAAEVTGSGRKDRFYAAFLEDRLVGFSMLRGWEEGYEVPSFGILVDHGHHGSGIGSRLTDFTIEQARALHSPRVRLSVYGTNERAYSMYARKGFVEESRTTVERRLGPDERIVMVLELWPSRGHGARR